MTWDEVQASYRGKQQLTLDSVLYPRHKTFPMGFSWASFVAQSVMVGCVEDIPIGADRFLTEEGVQPLRSASEAFSVATDDIYCFEPWPRDLPVTGKAPSVERLEIFSEVGIRL